MSSPFEKDARKIESSKSLLHQYEQKLKGYLSTTARPTTDTAQEDSRVLNERIFKSARNCAPKIRKNPTPGNALTEARKCGEWKNRVLCTSRPTALDGDLERKESLLSVGGNNRYRECVSYTRPYYGIMSKQLMQEGVMYEARKISYQKMIDQQELEIMELKKQLDLKEKTLEDKRLFPFYLEEQLKEIKGGYRRAISNIPDNYGY